MPPPSQIEPIPGVPEQVIGLIAGRKFDNGKGLAARGLRIKRKKYGVGDGFRTSQRCFNVVIRRNTAEHAMQRRTIAIQAFGGFIRVCLQCSPWCPVVCRIPACSTSGGHPR